MSCLRLKEKFLKTRSSFVPNNGIKRNNVPKRPSLKLKTKTSEHFFELFQKTINSCLEVAILQYLLKVQNLKSFSCD